mgnify:CR=1 FL=1
MTGLEKLLANTSDNQHLIGILSTFCQGAIAIDRQCRIVWLNSAYRTLLGLRDDQKIEGMDIETLLPTTRMPQVVKSGEAALLDLMQIHGRWSVVTRFPVKDDHGEVIGAIGFVFYDQLDSLEPLFDKFARLRSHLVSHNLIRQARYEMADMIGDSAVMQQLKRQALRAAQLDTTLMLLGETGTGKELLAQSIHQASPRANGPFVGINMAALPEALVEAELFGATAGAYTGADRKGRQGKIQLANGGTLFLDEVAEMPLAMQAKLLRVLQEREVEALGSNRLERVDVRVIAATAKDMRELVANGEFREDLYYRLNVLPIRLPALRERTDDIPALCELILSKLQHHSGLPALKLSAASCRWLQAYPWPGNVRELHNRLERACVMAEGNLIEPEDLGAADDLTPTTEPVEAVHPNPSSGDRQLLIDALKRAGGNKSQAARALGISRTALYQRLRKHNL